jgi:small subunit ribosomal protein S16
MFQKNKQKVLPTFDVNNRTTNPTPLRTCSSDAPAHLRLNQKFRLNTTGITSTRSKPKHNNTMVLRIRLARFGKKHAPFYNIVVAHARYVPPHQFPPRKSANSSSTPNPNLHHFAILIPRNRTARNSRPLEVLGTYDPKPQAPRPGDTHGRPWKDIRLDISRARYWVGVGAQPSDTAWRLLSMVGILEPQFRVGQVLGKVVKADSAAKSLIREGGKEEGGEAKL